MKRNLIFIFILLFTYCYAQDKKGYSIPSMEVRSLIDVELPPIASINIDSEKILYLNRERFENIRDIADKEIKLAGLHLNPATRFSGTFSLYNNIKFSYLGSEDIFTMNGIPQNARMTYFVWSPDKSKIAFTNVTDEGVELWYYDFEKEMTYQVTEATLNASAGRPYSWYKDGSGFLIKTIPNDKRYIPEIDKKINPSPSVYYNESGEKSRNRTYSNLLKDKNDEAYFSNLIASELYFIGLDGKKERIKEEGLHIEEKFSPDGNFLLVKELTQPFSYSVPMSRFPVISTVYSSKGEPVKEIDRKPLIEKLPNGFMAVQAGKRNITWRNDQPATLCWVEALDGGDPSVEIKYRDELFQWPAPFSGEKLRVARMPHRFASVLWGNDTIAIVNSYWRNTRTMKTELINPSDPGKVPVLIHDRNYQDKYSHPGNFEQEYNQDNQLVLKIVGDHLFLVGEGYTQEGQFPFLDQLNIRTLDTKRIYQSEYKDKELEIIELVDPVEGKLLIRLQSPSEYPNYYYLSYGKKEELLPVTRFGNPFKSLEKVKKEVIRYYRSDGVPLSGVLYLPDDEAYRFGKKLPLMMWAYPQDYIDKTSAAQSVISPNSFTYPDPYSPVYWTKKGYAVLDEVSFPIIGEEGASPNDTYLEQLVGNARAAITALDSMGIIDPAKVAIGGHSYGAFMVANLLTHSDLFAAGIAISGAYNRTLTPFGFQAEERTYWDAPEVYHQMSPFFYADKIETPLLLIHGKEDENVGTPVLQSERYYEALKSLGKTVRLVVLPHEGHTLKARESILHLLWEEEQWLDTYLMNR